MPASTTRPIATPEFAGALVRATDGRLLCQLRDEVPGIVCPGLWSCCPGGRIEHGESPDQAIIRELREEFGIAVEDLRHAFAHTEPDGGFAGTYHCFVARLATPPEQVKCYEGQRAELFWPRDALSLPQHPVSWRFVSAYLKQYPVS